MDPKTVRIFTNKETPRLSYIAGIIIGDIMGLPWEIITDKRKLWKHPVINYSEEDIAGSFRIIPHPLLFENDIVSQDIVVERWNDLPVFFTSDIQADFPFDIFAASFFLISRYEEYLQNSTDDNGRFMAISSIAFRNNFLLKPMVDIWTRELSKALLKKFRTIAFRRNEFRSLVIIDADEPLTFPGKNIFQSIGELVNDIATNSRKASRRYRSIAIEEKDPSGVFHYITGMIEKYQAEVRFFFPVGDHSRHYQNPSWKNSEYRKLISGIASKYKTGLYTYYESAGERKLVITETERLRAILETDVSSSRFHSLRLSLPRSYRDVLEAGITEDFSMGYPEEPGFRAGIARPFYFYDLPEEKRTCLKIYPFQVMDATFYNYKKLTSLEALTVISEILSETKKAGGLFISVWHNTTLLDNGDHLQWRELFEFMLNRGTDDSLS